MESQAKLASLDLLPSHGRERATHTIAPQPETRLEFSDADLKQIDQLAAAAQLGKASVLAAKMDPSRFTDAHFRRDAISGLERCAGELVADMLKVKSLRIVNSTW